MPSDNQKNHQNRLDLQKFFSAVEQTADSVFITDKDGHIEYVNKAFERTTGYKKKEILGKTPSVVKSGYFDKNQYKKLWETILSGKTYRAVVVNKKKSGDLFYADHTITPIKDPTGNITHFVGIWKDNTKQMELERREKEFIAIASHELKTPLTTLKGYVQLLEAGFGRTLDEKNKFFLKQVNTQADRISKLVTDLLDVNKIETGRLSLNKKRLNLDKLVKKTIEDLQNTSPSHQLIKTGSTKKLVYADEERIRQVLVNLLSNAVKYSPKGREVLIRVKANSKSIILAVQDRGKGISKKDLPLVFEKFYRGKNTTGDDVSGSGLGLYICSEIIHRHGGKIWAESEKNKGSVFFFSLPVKN